MTAQSSSERSPTFEQIYPMLRRTLLNADEVVAAWRSGRIPPSFRTRQGITIHHRWPLDPASFLFYEIFLLNCYTSNSFYSPERGDTILDCGANIGIFSLYLTTLEPNLHIHCVEPSQSTFKQLKFNVEANHLQNVVSLYQMAVWKDHGQQTLFPGPSSGKRSLFPQSHPDVSGPKEIVNCTTLGELCEVCGETEVALAKIDTEGAELEIVEAASAKTLRKIKRFAIEIHEEFRPGTRDRITKHLESHGFTLTSVAMPPNRADALGILRALRSEMG